MQYTLILIIPALLAVSNSFGQVNDAKMAIGIESTILISKKIPYMPFTMQSVSVSLPKGQFSLSLGLSRYFFKRKIYYDFTGESVTKGLFPEIDKQYFYRRSEFRPEYIVLKPRIIYRLPCNCVHIHFGYNLNFLRSYNKKTLNSEKSKTTGEPYEFNSTFPLRKLYTAMEFGLGFQMNFTELWRLVFRPMYIIYHGQAYSPNPSYIDKQVGFLQVSFTLEKGIK